MTAGLYHDILVKLEFPSSLYRYFKFRANVAEESFSISQQLNDYFDRIIETHQESFDPTDIRDYIDVYLAEIHQAKDGDLASVVTVKNLQATVLQVSPR